MPARFTRCSGSSAFSVPKRAALVTIISVSPMMALSGVRSSWLTLETNCDLCWLASASCRFLSWISSNSRTFSIAITAWSAKVADQLDLPVGEWLDLRALSDTMTPIGLLRAAAEPRDRAIAAQSLQPSLAVFRVGQDIGNVDIRLEQQRARDAPRPGVTGHILTNSLNSGETP